MSDPDESNRYSRTQGRLFGTVPPGRPKILITRRIPDAGLTLLAESADVTILTESEVPSKQSLIEAIQGKDACVSLLTEPVDREVLEAGLPSLKVVANYAVGFDNVDVKTATLLGIMVTNTPGVLTDATADLTWTLILSTARRVVEGDAFMRAGRYKAWAPDLFLGQSIAGKTLGIIGMGRIGKAVAKRSTGFDMRVLYYDERRDPDAEVQFGATFAGLDTVFRESDVLSVHVPLTDKTRHLISDQAFAKMKPTAILVNTSRGPIIDENALVRALRGGRIAGAGLDVYENEPLMAPGLSELPNTVLLPHLGSATHETRNRMAEMAAQNALAALRGEVPPNLVNPEVLQKLRMP